MKLVKEKLKRPTLIGEEKENGREQECGCVFCDAVKQDEVSRKAMAKVMKERSKDVPAEKTSDIDDALKISKVDMKQTKKDIVEGYLKETYNFINNGGSFNVNIKNRDELGKLVGFLNENKVKHTIKRSVVEGYRYNVTINGVRQIREEESFNEGKTHDKSELKSKIIYKALKEYEENHYMSEDDYWQEAINELIDEYRVEESFNEWKTRAQKHNDSMEKIFNGHKEQNGKYKNFLISKGYSKDEEEIIAPVEDDEMEESCKKSLEEKKWKYTLKAGDSLRKAIDSEEFEGIRNNLIKCYDELFEQDLIDEIDYENWVEEIKLSDFDDEDEIDYHLGNLYDLCDNLDVWIAVNESLKEARGINKTKKYSVPEDNFDGIKRLVEKCGFSVRVIRRVDGYVEFEVSGESNERECWDWIDKEIARINKHRNVVVSPKHSNKLGAPIEEGKKPVSMTDDELLKAYKDARTQVSNIMKKNPQSFALKDARTRVNKIQSEMKKRGMSTTLEGLEVQECNKQSMNEELILLADLDSDYRPWGQAVELWDEIVDEGKVEELAFLLEDMYPDGIKMVELNDLLAYEWEWVREQLGLVNAENDED